MSQNFKTLSNQLSPAEESRFIEILKDKHILLPAWIFSDSLDLAGLEARAISSTVLPRQLKEAVEIFNLEAGEDVLGLAGKNVLMVKAACRLKRTVLRDRFEITVAAQIAEININPEYINENLEWFLNLEFEAGRFWTRNEIENEHRFTQFLPGLLAKAFSEIEEIFLFEPQAGRLVELLKVCVTQTMKNNLMKAGKLVKAGGSQMIVEDLKLALPTSLFRVCLQKGGLDQLVISGWVLKGLDQAGREILVAREQKDKFQKEIFDWRIAQLIKQLNLNEKQKQFVLRAAQKSFKHTDERDLADVLGLAEKVAGFGGDFLAVATALNYRNQFKQADRIAGLVNNFNLLRNIPYAPHSKAHYLIKNYMDLFICGAEDYRVRLLLLAYKLRRLKQLPEVRLEEQRLLLYEVEDIFAPLAERFGFVDLAFDMLDQVFRLKDPEGYKEIEEKISQARGIQSESLGLYLEILKHDLFKLIKENNPGLTNLRILTRAKNPYSVLIKLEQGKYLEIKDFPDLQGIKGVYKVWGKDDYGSVEEKFVYYSQLINTVEKLGGTINFGQTEMHAKSGFHINLADPLLKTEIEFQFMTEAEYAREQWGECAHWAHKLAVRTGQSFDEDSMKGRTLTGSFEIDSENEKKALADYVYVLKYLESEGNPWLIPNRKKKNEIPADLAAGTTVNALDSSYGGVEVAELKFAADGALKKSALKFRRIGENYKFKNLDVVRVRTEPRNQKPSYLSGKRGEISRNSKKLRTLLIMHNLADLEAISFDWNGLSALRAYQAGFKILKKNFSLEEEKLMGKLAKELRLLSFDELCVALGTKNLPENIRENILTRLREIIKLYEVNVSPLPAEREGVSGFSLQMPDRPGILKNILARFDPLNLCSVERKLHSSLEGKSVVLKLWFFTPQPDDLKTFKQEIENLKSFLQDYARAVSPLARERRHFKKISIRGKSQQLLTNIIKGLPADINIFDSVLLSGRKNKPEGLEIVLEIPENLDRERLKKTLLEIKGINQQNLEFIPE